MPGPQAFAPLTTKLNREFDSGECTMALIRIQSFVTPTGTPLKAYLPKYEVLVTDTMHGDTHFLLKQDTIIHAIMKKIWTQYSTVVTVAFMKSYASSEAFTSYDDICSHLTVHNMGSQLPLQSHQHTRPWRRLYTNRVRRHLKRPRCASSR